jgi:hypothetical protein
MMSAFVGKQVLLSRLNGLRQIPTVPAILTPLLRDRARASISIREFDWARLTFELDSYMDEVHVLVRTIYRT